MGEAPPVLGGGRWRIAGAAVLVALLLAYAATAAHFPELSSWLEVAWMGALFAPLFALVWLALPLARRNRGWLALAGAACVVVALVTTWADLHDVANIAKLGAATAAGFLFVSVFEQASWLVAVALVIPLADTWSVWAGPTRKIVTEAPAVFDAYSVALPFPATRVVILRWDEVPGAAGYEVVAQRKGGPRRSFDLEEQRSFALGVSTRHPYTFAVIALGTPSGARLSCQTGCEDVAVIRSTPSLGVEARTRLGYDRLGLTDVVFFALFLAGAAMFRLRAGWTWVGLWLGVALTGVFGYLDPFGIGGVPALPLISLGFLLPNADLLWSGLRRRGD